MDCGSKNIHIYFPFSLFVSVYWYASVCDFVCIALLLPFVLGFYLSIFFFFAFFSIVFSTCYHWWICFLVWLLSFFFFFFFFCITLIFFNNCFFIFYFNNFILFYFILFHFILSSSFFLSFFSPFYSELCGGQALGAPDRHQCCASEVGEPSSGHWSKRDLPATHNIKW